MLTVQATLTIALGFVVVGGLRLLEELSYRLGSSARRVRFRKGIDDVLALDGLPELVRRRVAGGDALFLFVSRGCTCDLALLAAASLSRVYTDVEFVLCAGPASWPEVDAMEGPRLHVVHSQEFEKEVGTVMYPYFLKATRGRVVEYGVANTPEQVEAILEARDAA